MRHKEINYILETPITNDFYYDKLDEISQILMIAEQEIYKAVYELSIGKDLNELNCSDNTIRKYVRKYFKENRNKKNELLINVINGLRENICKTYNPAIINYFKNHDFRSRLCRSRILNKKI